MSFYAELKKQFKGQKIVGLDEVGRGALAGPLVVGAVEIDLELDGITDSKLLSRAKREQFFGQIIQNCRQVSLGIVAPEMIDQLGLAQALKIAYAQALSRLSCQVALTDAYDLKNPDIVQIKAVRGDTLFYPTSCASIVAKVYRDQLMQMYHYFHPEYGWDQNVGYGTARHLESIKKYGPSKLHRQSFITKEEDGSERRAKPTIPKV